MVGVSVGPGVSVMVEVGGAVVAEGVGESVVVGVGVSVGVKVNVGGKPVVGMGVGVSDGSTKAVGTVPTSGGLSTGGPDKRLITKTITRMVSAKKTKLMTLYILALPSPIPTPVYFRQLPDRAAA